MPPAGRAREAGRESRRESASSATANSSAKAAGCKTWSAGDGHTQLILGEAELFFRLKEGVAATGRHNSSEAKTSHASST